MWLDLIQVNSAAVEVLMDDTGAMFSSSKQP